MAPKISITHYQSSPMCTCPKQHLPVQKVDGRASNLTKARPLHSLWCLCCNVSCYSQLCLQHMLLCSQLKTQSSPVHCRCTSGESRMELASSSNWSILLRIYCFKRPIRESIWIFRDRSFHSQFCPASAIARLIHSDVKVKGQVKSKGKWWRGDNQ